MSRFMRTSGVFLLWLNVGLGLAQVATGQWPGLLNLVLAGLIYRRLAAAS